MRKVKFLLIFMLVTFNLLAQMPTNGDYTNWNWENSATNNWQREKNNKWQSIPSPFTSTIDRINLMYEIYSKKDYTYQKGWRLVHANFKGTFPYFVLYNINSSVLRGFVYVEGDAGIPYGNSIIMTVTPDYNLKTTKLLHLSENVQYAVEDKSSGSLFSQASVSAITTSGLNSWAALEIPLLFDNTISNLSSNWTIEFFSGTNSNISFEINGTSVPMDPNGNNLFAHPQKVNTVSSLKADYAKIHTNIKNISEWGEKLTTNADKIKLDSKTPSFLKKYKETSEKLGNTIKVVSTIAQISSGIEVALGIFDFFFGGSSSTIPTGYSHNFTGTGSINTLQYLRGTTLSVPGSKNASIPSWGYNCGMGVINLKNTPTVKKTASYEYFSNLPKVGGVNRSGFTLAKDKFGQLQLAYSESRNNMGFGIPNAIYICYGSQLEGHLVKYKFWDNIDLNIKSGVNIIEAKFALLCKTNNENDIINSQFKSIYRYYVSASVGNRSVVCITPNPIYNLLQNEKYTLYEYDKTNKVFIFGTPYMTLNQLKNVNFETVPRGDIYLGVLIKYMTDKDNEPRFYKGTYKVNINQEATSLPKYLGSQPNNSFLTSTHSPTKLGFNYFNNCNSSFTTGLRSIGGEEFNNVTLYPNPTNGIVYLKTSKANDKCKVDIYNTSGKLVYSKENVVNGEVIDLSMLNKGIYIVKINTDGEIKTEKVILK
ncbi:MAG: T9SS type A sorting domain-containing protein [Dysgonomonas sp.]|nr:T9SS type A sorting domain-containing protein [Dysgonomonas sp.]